MLKEIYYNDNGTLKGAEGLFVEWATRREDTRPVYTLAKEDGELPSLYKLYMSCEDLTEWEFADKYLAGWDHLEYLQQNLKFIKILDSWRKDLEQKLKSRAFRAIQLIAEEGGKNSFEANKLLLTGKWKEVVEKAGNARGRPSKRELDKIANEEYESTKSIRDDLKRLGIDLQ